MRDLDLPLIVSFGLIFIVVLFWVQTLYAYWQCFFSNEPMKKDPETLLSFTVFLTLVAIVAIYIHQCYPGQQSKMTMINPPDEINAFDDELGLAFA